MRGRSAWMVQAVAAAACVAHGTVRASELTLPWFGTFEANQTNAHLGYSAACAGDVNGDGFSDLVLGVRDYTGGQANEGRVVVYDGSSTGYSPAPSWSFESDQSLAFLGAAVACAGDVNGDGFHDVLVAAPSYDDGESNEGIVRLFLGGAAGLGTSPVWSRGGDQATAAFGTAVAFAGDVNADGYDDVIIGARGADGAFSNEGCASLFFGNSGGLAASPAWSVTGGQVDPGFGWSVSGAGDVNADGFCDVLVGAFFHDAGETDEGAAFLYLGGPAGLATLPAWTGQGNQANAGYGWSVAGAGDVNGDGFADAIVGARYFDGALSNEGKVFVYLGGAAGLSPAPVWTAVGGEANAYLGWSVASAGDVNGDGLADLVLGAPKKDATLADAGVARLVVGRREAPVLEEVWSVNGAQAGAQLGWCVASAGDADGDGFADLVASAPYGESGQSDEGIVTVYRGSARVLEAAPTSRLDGGPTSSSYSSTLAFLGDVNGDGLGDLAVGDPFHSNGQVSEGRVDVFYGTALGYDTTPDWSVESDQVSAFFGWSVARAGDVNGDGYDDLLIGAPNWDGAYVNEGRASLYFGSDTGLSPIAAWTRLGGQAGGNFGAALAGGGDGDGDGYADIVVGAPLQDAVLPDVGAVHWFRGGANGPGVFAQRFVNGSLSGDEFGASVAHSGDANGDGFDDVLVGIPGHSDGETSEGRVVLLRGAPLGIETIPAWSASGGEMEARFGGRVAFAGDVNGDGFTDVLVSGRGFDGTSFDEGKAMLFLGSALGPVSSAVWSSAGGEEGAELDAIASAGDVNADGFGDIVVGASWASVASSFDGRARLFRGAIDGPESSPAWSLVGSAPFARLGSAFAGPGDVNGDGFSDLGVGAPGLADSVGTGGAAWIAFGNGGVGASRALRQRCAAGSAPIALGGASDSGNRFRAVISGQSPAGRSRVRFEIEPKLCGTHFDATGLVLGPWMSSTSARANARSGAMLDELVPGFFAGARIHWRARVRTPSPIFPSSPWISPAGNTSTELDLRLAMGGPTSVVNELPIASRPVLSIGSLSPHPVRRSSSFVVSASRDVSVEIVLFDVRGRRVRTVARGTVPPGRHTFTLDARDDAGLALASGVYVLRVESETNVAARRVVVVR